MTEKSPADMTFPELCELLSYTPKNRPLTPPEVCEFLGVTDVCLRQQRTGGFGPYFLKAPGSRLVRYAEIDVLRWFAFGRRQSTSELKEQPKRKIQSIPLMVELPPQPGDQPRPWDPQAAQE